MATMAEVRRITWSIYWKWMLISIIGGFVAGFVAGALIGGVVGAVSGASAVKTEPWPSIIKIISGSLGFCVGFLTLNYLLARSIGKQIGSKKLVLVDAFTAGEN
jgi:F0F1-type ATP synthase assembly protein I